MRFRLVLSQCWAPIGI